MADLLGDGHKEIVIGRNEEYTAAQDGGLNASANSYNAALAAARDQRVVQLRQRPRLRGLQPTVPTTRRRHATRRGHGVPTNAYVCNWPVKVAKFDLELLPDGRVRRRHAPGDHARGQRTVPG